MAVQEKNDQLSDRNGSHSCTQDNIEISGLHALRTYEGPITVWNLNLRSEHLLEPDYRWRVACGKILDGG